MTLAEAIADVRAAIAHDSDTQVTDAQLTTWINQAYQTLRRKLGDLYPDLYTVVMATQVLSGSTSTFSISALTDFGKVRKLERQDGTLWVRIPVAPSYVSGVQATRGFRLTASTIEIFPSSAAAGSYRLSYVSIPAAVVSGSLVVPPGGERVIVEGVAARARVRLKQDPGPHLAMQKAEWEDLRDGLSRQYLSTPQSVIDLSGRW